MPFRAEEGMVGRTTTVPSGWMKNLSRSPGLIPRCSRIALGMVTCPFLLTLDSTSVIGGRFEFLRSLETLE